SSDHHPRSDQPNGIGKEIPHIEPAPRRQTVPNLLDQSYECSDHHAPARANKKARYRSEPQRPEEVMCFVDVSHGPLPPSTVATMPTKAPTAPTRPKAVAMSHRLYLRAPLSSLSACSSALSLAA